VQFRLIYLSSFSLTTVSAQVASQRWHCLVPECIHLITLLGKGKMSTSVVNAGLIGYGLAGAVFHAPLIQAEKRLKLAAISTNRALGPDVAGVARVKSVWEIISDPAIDLVVVASQNQLTQVLLWI
jgi:hypothetical protein